MQQRPVQNEVTLKASHLACNTSYATSDKNVSIEIWNIKTWCRFDLCDLKIWTYDLQRNTGHPFIWYTSCTSLVVLESFYHNPNPGCEWPPLSPKIYLAIIACGLYFQMPFENDKNIFY